MDGKLYRSERERMVLGVCGGIGNYLGLDPTIIRLFFVIFTIVNQIGIVLYLALAIFMPVAPPEEDYAREEQFNFNLDSNSTGNLLGIALVVVGAFALMGSLDIQWLSWISMENFLPILLVGFGLYVLFGRRNTDE